MTLTNWGFEDSAIDGECLRRADKSNMRFAPDGEHPRRYTGKLRWLKWHDRCSGFGPMVDKYEPKRHLAERMGGQYVIPACGVWNTAAPSCPKTFDGMKALAGILSWGIPYIHGDFCEVDGKAYFGELAFSQWHGASFRLNPTRGGFAKPLPFNTLPFKVDGICRPLAPPLLPQSFLFPGLHRFVEQRLRFFPKVEAA